MDFTHRGVKFSVLPHGVFYVPELRDPNPKNQREGGEFETYKAARAAIDAHLAQAKIEAKKKPLALPCVREAGPLTLVGVDGRTRKAKFSEADVVGSGDGVWPEVPWIVELVEQRADLGKKLRRLREALRPFMMSDELFGSRANVDHEKAARIYADFRAKAEATTMAAELQRADEKIARQGSRHIEL